LDRTGGQNASSSVTTNAPGAVLVDLTEELVQRNTGAWAITNGQYHNQSLVADHIPWDIDGHSLRTDSLAALGDVPGAPVAAHGNHLCINSCISATFD
jgi:hypothetical protein